MNKTKNTVLIVAAAVAVLAVIGVSVAFYSASIKNESNLNALMDRFADIVSEQEGVEIVESQSIYGKLNGNGNGINYFGAVLVKRSSVSDIDALITRLGRDFESAGYLEQKDSAIVSEYLEHKNLSYKTEILDNGEYITVYFYDSTHPNSDYLDLAAH